MSAGAATARKPAERETYGQRSQRSLEELVSLVERHPTEDLDLSPTELMLLIGSPDGFVGNAPSQQASLMDCRENEHIRVLAFLLEGITRNGPGTAGRWPYSRNPDGTPRMAADIKTRLGMKLPNVLRAIDKLIEQKRVRKDDKGRLWLCGAVPKPTLVKLTGEEKEIISTDNDLKRLVKRNQQLKENEAMDFRKRRGEAEDLKDDLEADSKALISYLMDTIFRGIDTDFGVKSEPRRNARDFAKKPPKVKQIAIKTEMLSVLITYDDAEKSVRIESVPTENESVRIRINKETETRERTSSSSSEAVSTVVEESAPGGPPEPKNPTTTAFSPDESQIAQAMRENGAKPDQAAVADLAAECRREAPDCATAEIVHFIHEKAPRCREKAKMTGFLLRAVPRCFAGDAFRKWRETRPPLLTSPPAAAVDWLEEELAKELAKAAAANGG